MSVPNTVTYNGTEIPAVSPSSDCDEPYALDQDCSGASGAKRKIQFQDHMVRIAGSSDGSVVLIMANKLFGFDTMRLTIATTAIESFLIEKGLNIIERQAIAANGEIFGFYLVFDSDAYSILKEYTIDD